MVFVWYDSNVWENVRWSKIDNIRQEAEHSVDWDELNGRSHAIGAIDDYMREDYYSGIFQIPKSFQLSPIILFPLTN